jgi:NAD(P)-dependent dehydrogenase (short-subunit alcohol dehydrogenase family)
VPEAVSNPNDEILTGKSGKPIIERFRLDGRVALVTGAGQGIGRGFAHALGEAGAQIAVVDIDKQRAASVVEELSGKGIVATGITVDISDWAAAQGAVIKAAEMLGRLDIAVNNAGLNRNSAAEATSAEEWDEAFALNTRGLFACCQAEARVMLKTGYGKIINVASMASLIVPHPQKQAAYNASKAAVLQLTRTLAAEWADRGIRVNCISPGIINTALIATNEALRPLVVEWVKQIPLGRLGEVSDLQAAIVYLACEASDYMTGHNLVIEGGQTLW